MQCTPLLHRRPHQLVLQRKRPEFHFRRFENIISHFGERKGQLVCARRENDAVYEAAKGFLSYIYPKASYLADSLSNSRRRQNEDPAAPVSRPGWLSPIYALIALHVIAFLMLPMLYPSASGLGQLHLNLKDSHWLQALTSGFLHVDALHLAETAFHTYIWGSLVEEKRGASGFLVAYLASLCGANMLSWLAFPAKTSAVVMTSSAAWVGLFAVGIFWPRVMRKPLELLCITPFVIFSGTKRFSNLAPFLIVDGYKVGHLVHPLGAFLVGSLLAATFRALDAMQAWLEQFEENKKRAARGNRQP